MAVPVHALAEGESHSMKNLRAINQKIIDLFVVNPSSGSSLAYMDGIRAIAVIFVFCFDAWTRAGGPQMLITVPGIHYVISLSGLFAYMSVGVDLFFVLSGFLLAQHWMRADYLGTPKPSLKQYFKQRVFRIVPAYYVCLFVTVLLLTPAIVPLYVVTGRYGALGFLAHLTFLQYVFPLSAGSYGVDGQFWTLTIEALFYLSLPLFVRFFLRNRWMIALPIAALITVGWLSLCRNAFGPLVNFYGQHLSLPLTQQVDIREILSYQYPGHFLHFALGITLANLYIRWQLGMPAGRLFRALTSRWAGAGYFFVGSFIVLYAMNKVSWFASQVGYDYRKYVTDPQGRVPYYLHGIPFAIGFTLMIAGVLFGARWLQAAFSFTPLRLVGLLGYSIYLWHLSIIIVLGTLPAIVALTPARRFPVLLAAGAAVTLLISVGSYLAIEKPFILRGRSRAPRRSVALAPQEFERAATTVVHTAPMPTGETGFLRFFSIPSSSGTKVPYLDGIRAIAVIFVLIRHSWALSGAPEISIPNLFSGGQIRITPYLSSTFVGVDLFFVLSGFLLAQYWIRADFQDRPRPSLRAYFRNRFTRIFPAYYACLFLMLLFLTPYLISPQFVYSSVGAFMLGAHLTFTHYLFPLSAADYIVNGSMWTLTLEMTFYLVLPWAILLFLRNRWLITVPLLSLCSIGWLYLSRHSLGPLVRFDLSTVAQYGVDEATIRHFLSEQFPGFFTTFGVGIVIANLYWQYKTEARAYRVLRHLTVQWMAAVYFVLGWALLLYAMNRATYVGDALYYYLGNIAVAVAFGLILVGVMAGSEALQGLFSLVPLRFVGIIGYSVFLWHMPLIYLFNKYPAIAALAPRQRFTRVLLLTTVAVLILGALSYLFVERPFMLLSRRRPAAVAIPVTQSPGDAASPQVAAATPAVAGSRSA
jgi:peptidoglycan/LPS O-acetylase OafA/YrhL